MSTPKLRATDNERNTVIAYLNEALSNGKLDFNEFDERSKAVYAAVYRDELLIPLADLSPDPEQLLGKQLAPRPESNIVSSQQIVRPSAIGDSFSGAIMSGVDKKGVWTVASTHNSIAIMGGVLIDLTYAQFAQREVTINAWAIMGGVQIIVPEDVQISNQGMALMGGITVEDDPAVTMPLSSLPDNAPRLIVGGLALMGGVEVKRVPRPN